MKIIQIAIVDNTIPPSRDYFILIDSGKVFVRTQTPLPGKKAELSAWRTSFIFSEFPLK